MACQDLFGEFFRREIWHGAGDVTTLKLAVESKVVIAAFVFLVAHMCIILSLIFNPVISPLLVISFVVIIAICIASAWKKYSLAPVSIIMKNIVLFYIYYWGRSIAIVNRIVPFLLHRQPKSRKA